MWSVSLSVKICGSVKKKVIHIKDKTMISERALATSKISGLTKENKRNTGFAVRVRNTASSTYNNIAELERQHYPHTISHVDLKKKRKSSST